MTEISTLDDISAELEEEITSFAFELIQVSAEESLYEEDPAAYEALRKAFAPDGPDLYTELFDPGEIGISPEEVGEGKVFGLKVKAMQPSGITSNLVTVLFTLEGLKDKTGLVQWD